MNRTEVIVHMYVSIDGKIDGRYMEEEGCDASGTYYDDEIFKMASANGNGANTVAMYAANGNVDLSQYDISGIAYEDWTGDIAADTWDVSFDRKGRCMWQVNYFDYAGYKSQALEVVTKQADLHYLSFLRSMKIPYIIAGEKDMDIPLALRKLKEEFGIEKMALCGGAIINGAFLNADCVDRISLVMAPYVSGEADQKASFDTLGTFVNQKFVFEKAIEMKDGGVQLLFRKQ